MSEQSKDSKVTFSDSSPVLSIVATPLLPLDCHVMMRGIPPQEKFPANIHKYHMLCLCLSGKGGLSVDNMPYTLTAGEAILIAPGHPHYRTLLSDEDVQWLNIRFTLKDEPEWLTLMHGLPFFLDEEMQDRLSEFRKTYDRYHENQERPGGAEECILQLALLLNRIQQIGRTNPTMMPADNPQNVVQWLCRHLVNPEGKDKSFAALSKEIGLSPGYLRTMFKKVTGHTPRNVGNRHRLQLAENLLSHSDLNITEIANRLGFGSIYSFSRFFKKHIGVSPLRFRTLAIKQTFDGK